MAEFICSVCNKTVDSDIEGFDFDEIACEECSDVLGGVTSGGFMNLEEIGEMFDKEAERLK